MSNKQNNVYSNNLITTRVFKIPQIFYLCHQKAN